MNAPLDVLAIMAHPDERSTVAFYAPTLHWPSSLEEALEHGRE